MKIQTQFGDQKRILSRINLLPRLLSSTAFLLFALVAMLAAPTVAQAQVITWGGGTEAADTDILNVGNLVCAYAFSGQSQTVNGVSFIGTATITGVSPNFGLSSPMPLSNSAGGYTNQAGVYVPPLSTLSMAYLQTIQGGTHTANNTTFTLTVSNLVVGKVYALQLWILDARTTSSFDTRTMTLAGLANTNNFITLAYNYIMALGGVGQYAIGVFTATNTTCSFYSTGAAPQINAFQVRDVTGTGYTPPPLPVRVVATWNGGSAVNSNWSDTNNWSGTNIVNNTYFAAANFTGTARQTNMNDLTGLILGSVSFTNSNWNITGNPVTLNGAFAANVPGTNIWGLDTILNVTPVITLTNAGGVLNFPGLLSGAGAIALNNSTIGSSTLVLANPNNSFTGTIYNFGGNLIYSTLAPGGQNSSLGAATTPFKVGTPNSPAGFTFIGTTSVTTDRGLVLTNNNVGGGVFFNNNSPNNSSQTFNASSSLSSTYSANVAMTLYDSTANDVFNLYLGGTSSGTNTFNGQLLSAALSVGIFNANLNVSGPGTWAFNDLIYLTNSLNIGAGSHFALGYNPAHSSSTILFSTITVQPGGVFDVSSFDQNGSPFILGPYSAYPETMTIGRPSGVSATDINGSLSLGGAASPVLNIAGNGVPGTLTIAGGFIPATGSGAGTINFDLANTTTTGGAVNDLIQVNGDVNLSAGTANVIVNPISGTLQTGTPYTLISYTGSLSGSAAGLTVPLPGRLYSAGVVSTTTPGKVTVTFNPSGELPAPHLLWQGFAGSQNWDVDTTANWSNGGNSDFFFNHDNAFFDDTASQFNVNLVGTVMPGIVTVTNNINDYTFGGGQLAGAASLVKQGTRMLTLNATNLYNGGTIISGGTLTLASPGALGTGLITITNTGVLAVANPNSLAVIPFTNTVTGTGNFNVTNNEVVNLIGSNVLAGFNGAVNVANGGVLWVSGLATTPAAINVSGTGSGTTSALQVDGSILAGPINLQGNTTLGVTTNLTSTISGNISDGGHGYGLSANCNGVLVLNGTNTYSGLTRISGVQGGMLTFNNSATITGDIYVNGQGTATGGGVAARLGDNVNWPVGRTITLDDTAGRAAVYLGTNTMVLGNIVMAGNLLTGGNINTIATASPGSSNVIAGNIVLASGATASQVYVRADIGGTSGGNSWIKCTGNINLGTGTIEQNSGIMVIASTGNVWSSLLLGGSLVGTNINGVADALCTSATVNLSTAGTYDLAGYNQTIAGLISAVASTVNGNGSQSGSTGNNTLTINVSSGTNYAFSGLIKNTYGKLNVVHNGPGTQTFSGANAYTGNTTVNGGTLNISQATLAAGSTITIASGAVLNLGFTTTNKVNALVLNGVNQPQGVVYNSANTGGLITGTGSLLVVPFVATNPTNMTATVSGGNLNLAWPADHTGWRLLMQTNNLAAGISVNTNDWTTVAGSANTNQISLPVNAAQPAEFYRLVYP